MSRKDWTEGRRCEEIEKYMDIIDKAEVKLDHLSGPDWQKAYPKENE